MNTCTRIGTILLAALLLLLWGCGGSAQPTPKEGVVYLDPNAPATPQAQSTDAPAPQAEAAPAVAAATEPPASEEPVGDDEPGLDLYFESQGVRIVPMMAADEVLPALGQPIGTFEADSCAYIGKDIFYYFPGFELTVNDVDGQNVITGIAVVDDTVTIPQGLRIYDDEEKLLSVLGGTEENGVYTYQSGKILLLIQVKGVDDDVRRIVTMEYRAVEDR